MMKIRILIPKTLGSYENERMDKLYFKQNRKLFVMCNSFHFITDLGWILTKAILLKMCENSCLCRPFIAALQWSLHTMRVELFQTWYSKCWLDPHLAGRLGILETWGFHKYLLSLWGTSTFEWRSNKQLHLSADLI